MTSPYHSRGAPIVLSAVILLVVSACTLPGPSSPNKGSNTGGSNTTQHSLSGTISDFDTGAGINGATVTFGKYSATTDSSGGYTLTLDKGVTSVTDNFAVTDGTTYDFFFFENATIDASSDPTNINLGLMPRLHSTGTVTISGKVYDSTGTTELTNVKNVTMTIYSGTGGARESNSTYTTGTGYTLTTSESASSCFIAVKVTFSDSSATTFYLKNVDLGSTTVNLDLDVPPAGSFTSVTANGVALGDSLEIYLVVPTFGGIVVGGVTPSSTSVTFPVYDPDAYRVMYLRTRAGDVAVTGTQALAASVTLPSPALTIPSSIDNLSGAAYAGGSLSFAAASDATAHWVVLGTEAYGDSSGTPIGLSGYLWLTNASVTLPASVQSVIASGTGWDVASYALNMTGVDVIQAAHWDEVSSGALYSIAPSSFELGYSFNQTNGNGQSGGSVILNLIN